MSGNAPNTASGKAVSKADYDDLYELRAAVEASARLLNGRTGNLAALQSSSRWNILNDVAKNRKVWSRLDELSGSSDKGVAKAASSLKKVVDAISASAKNNWNNQVGRVMSETDLPVFGRDSNAQDESPNGGLSAHDKRFHGGNYDGKGKCEFREKMSKGDENDLMAQYSQKDYADLVSARNRLEPVARLLNGRTGNLAALQASSRWNKLNDLPSDSAFYSRLDALTKVDDIDASKIATDLKKVADAIATSKKNNWNTPAGMVCKESDIPKPKESPAQKNESPSSAVGGQGAGAQNAASTVASKWIPLGADGKPDMEAVHRRWNVLLEKANDPNGRLTSDEKEELGYLEDAKVEAKDFRCSDKTIALRKEVKKRFGSIRGLMNYIDDHWGWDGSGVRSERGMLREVAGVYVNKNDGTYDLMVKKYKVKDDPTINTGYEALVIEDS